MGKFDEEPIVIKKVDPGQVETLRITKVNVVRGKGKWSASVTVEAFGPGGKSLEGVTIGLYFGKERLGVGVTDDWGEAVIESKLASHPGHIKKPWVFEARVKQSNVRAISEEIVIGETNATPSEVEETETGKTIGGPNTDLHGSAEAAQDTFSMAKIPAGGFQMGSPSEEKGRGDGELQHLVTITRPFLVGVCPVTQGIWISIMGSNPSQTKKEAHPVENVSWFEAIEFCNRKSQSEGLACCYSITGDRVTWDRDSTGYRLPTECEWEYACRAGTTTERHGELDAISWNFLNSEGETHPVGKKRPNNLRLFDMIGNVYEWVWDWHFPYSPTPASDPIGPASGIRRVIRGGSWLSKTEHCRSAFRGCKSPDGRLINVGFRLARSLL